ncbi:hypothetical protein V2I01_16930 [Micromonospora sp. BRA006-A]|nr:hypothetical protein [Micromonospora sp. BRA006-A]
MYDSLAGQYESRSEVRTPSAVRRAGHLATLVPPAPASWTWDAVWG